MTQSAQREWNSAAYQKLSDPQFAWGLAVLQRLALRGDETVLDAGCGTGRVTAELIERLPAGRVIATDLSYNMMQEARRNLAHFGSRVVFLQSDLSERQCELDL